LVIGLLPLTGLGTYGTSRGNPAAADLRIALEANGKVNAMTAKGNRNQPWTRKGLSLIELMVVIAIIAILIGLLIPAVIKVRETALRTHSVNNLRQIAIATLHYADSHNSNLPNMSPRFGYPMEVTFCLILPYLEQQGIFDYINGSLKQTPFPDRCPSVYRNPLDPSVGARYPPVLAAGYPLTSYVCNAQVFLGNPNMVQTFADGTSNTLLYTEQYGWNCGGTMYVYTNSQPRPRWLGGGDPWANLYSQTRPTFADQECDDFYPITIGNVSMASAGKTFQVAPSIAGCDPRIPNSSTSAGLQVAMADGTVRILSPAISPSVFWGAVTPNGSEVIGLE
jgi:prepilin-type N-terminal cleavage/methylation domain-containing protein